MLRYHHTKSDTHQRLYHLNLTLHRQGWEPLSFLPDLHVPLAFYTLANLNSLEVLTHDELSRTSMPL